MQCKHVKSKVLKSMQLSPYAKCKCADEIHNNDNAQVLQQMKLNVKADN